MPKHILALVFCLFLFTGVFAQKTGLVYYLKNSGKLVSKDSADYSMVVLPPDTNVDKNLYVVYEYDKDGKVRLVTNSKTKDINLLYQGSFIAYYPNGRKMRTGNFIDGKHDGREFSYYPSGNLYTVMDYQVDGNAFFRDCRDLTGNILAENGKGKWIQFNDNFTEIVAEGNIENGVEEGEWHGKLNEYSNYLAVYHNGKVVSSKTIDNPSSKSVYKPIEKVPEFPGGMEAFGRFLNNHIYYPDKARKNGTQGKIIVAFIIERDGSATDLKVVRGIGDGCDEEALRVMKLMPKWKPGMQDGKSVRVAYSVPVSFTLSN